jgi:DNA-binding response OmpR family regulator
VSEHRLLIIDDHPHFGQLIGDVAETAGFAIVVTQHVDEFLEHLDRFRPTAITVDLLMPEVDGIELLRELALRGIRAKILVSSGADERMLSAAAELGVEMGLLIRGVIAKPLRAAELRTQLEKLKD